MRHLQQQWVLLSRVFKGALFVVIALASWQVQAEYSLFKVSVKLKEAESRKAQYDEAIAKAARIELIRLTGRLDINRQPEVKPFLKKPQNWITSYQYLPIEQEGVVVGNLIEFQFNEKKIYEYFEQQNLLVWPLNLRPKTLVMGTQVLGGSETYLDQQGLKYLPTVDYRNSAGRLGLPIVVPANTKLWTKAKKVEGDKKVAYAISEAKADFLMAYEVFAQTDGTNEFYWKLYNQNGKLVKQGQASNKQTQNNLRNVFASLLNYYSRAYRDQASFLGSVTLEVTNVNSVEQLTELENTLVNLKPLIHQAKLTQLHNFQASFDLIYQGKYEHLLNRLQKVKGLTIEQHDPLTTLIEARWGKPKRKVIDLRQLGSQERGNP